MNDLKHYRTWIFDCDGVLLDSNKIKSEAFYETALPYGNGLAKALQDYHENTGGVSRFEKFRYFLEVMLSKDEYQSDMERLLLRYSSIVKDKLLQCSETSGMRSFISKMPSTLRKIVVSGGLQEELREIFVARRLNNYFDAVFGSPDSKNDILHREIETGQILFPAVMVGDSQYDFECSNRFGIDFIMMVKYTEFREWPSFLKDKNVMVINNLNDLFNAFE